MLFAFYTFLFYYHKNLKHKELSLKSKNILNFVKPKESIRRSLDGCSSSLATLKWLLFYGLKLDYIKNPLGFSQKRAPPPPVRMLSSLAVDVDKPDHIFCHTSIM